MQLVLRQAPEAVGGMQGMEAQKWMVRVEKMYAEYVKMKMGADFINKEDLQLVQTFNKKNEKDNAVMEFIARNLKTYMNKLGESLRNIDGRI